MPEVGIVEMVGSGDIGAGLVSRYHFRPQTTRSITSVDAGAACYQARALHAAMASVQPLGVSWNSSVNVTVIDEASAVLQRYLADPNPVAASPGSGPPEHPAGLGVRANLRTSVVSTKRLMRGAIYIIPICAVEFTGQGGVTGLVLSNLDQAINNLKAGLGGAGLDLVVYHRPAKGATTGGKAAVVQSWDIPNTPAGLRSRRS